jgi:predicted dehydrogenase
VDRRDFLRVASGAGALGLSAWNHRALAGVSANNRINVGFIGLGGQGTGRLTEFMKHADMNVAGLCDADTTHLSRAAELVKKERGSAPPTFGDFRKLLDSKDVDAVVIATPDHWHALLTVMACQAGKDVYVEKPLCHSIAEGRYMIRAARQYKRITKMGNQIHNDFQTYRRVVELIRSGMLGRVDRVYCWMSAGPRGIGNPPNEAPPPDLNYDLWLGPAPKRPYNRNRSHFMFRNFWDYSGGVFIDFWCHISDVVYWALDLKAPKSVSAAGARKVSGEDNGETPNFLDVLYEFPNGPNMSWHILPKGIPGFDTFDRGCVFQCAEATVFVRYESYDKYVKGNRIADLQPPHQTIPNSPGHIREFLDSLKSRELTTCNIEYAHRLTKGGLLGNLAFRTGRRLYWDDEKERIVGDPKAQQLVTRQYRKPWKLA